MNLFELMAKISLDTKDYDSGVKESESKFAKLASGIKTGAAAMAKAAAAGLTAVAGATTALGTSAVKAYGDYEQLAGGVNKIFGKSQQQVLKNAEKAYKNAGLSTNEYLETVTSFSASLVQGLKTVTDATTAQELAAEKADMAINDMADNANMYGTAISSLQTAYAGFAKQNYTMLDNLKLG